MKKLTIMLLFFALLSCSKIEQIDAPPPIIEDPIEGTLHFTNEVNYARALSIANEATERFGSELTKNVSKTVVNSDVVVSNEALTKSGTSAIDTLMYVFNYAEGGYVVIPTVDIEGDVIAYVEEGEFNIQDTLTNDLSRFLVSLMMDHQRVVQAKYARIMADTTETKTEIVRFASNGTIGPRCTPISSKLDRFGSNIGPQYPPPPQAEQFGYEYYKRSGCYAAVNTSTSEHETLEPMLTTTWSQGSPYNNQAKAIGSGRAVAGCVAIAMAQIMVYFEHPKTYPSTILNFNMPADLKAYANTKIALSDLKRYKNIKLEGSPGARDYGSRFIAIVGYMLNNDWGVLATSASSADAPGVFNNLGYGVPPIRDYKTAAIMSELRRQKPVYISGYRNCEKGHAWVIDGYKINNYSTKNYIYLFDAEDRYNGRRLADGQISSTDIYLHCNFGWGGTSNGYYADNLFNTSRVNETTGSVSSEERYYRYDLKIVTNITKL